MSNLEIYSQNMAIDHGDVDRRYYDLSSFVMSLQPDLFLAQEVSAGEGFDNLQKLTENLRRECSDEYNMSYAQVYPGQEDEQGVAVISAMDLKQSKTVEFSTGGNLAQLIEVSVEGAKLAVVNFHLVAAPTKEVSRSNNLREMLKHLRQEGYGNDMQILAGDASTPPFNRGIRDLKKRGYRSAFEEVHGKEPDYTFPAYDSETLIKGGYIKPKELRWLKMLDFAMRPIRHARGESELPHYTMDYILANIPRAIRADVVRAKNKDPKTPSMSDHLGLIATYSI